MSQPKQNEKTPTPFALNASDGFNQWLYEIKASLLFTTYQAGKIFLVGLDDNQNPSIFNRTFERAMAMHAEDKDLYLSTQYQLWKFRDVLDPGTKYEGHDRLYVPRKCWVTGNLDIHDIAISKKGVPFFINTLFSCIAEVSDTHSFKPLWKPSFVSALTPEDRCHLNGMAVENHEPRYVTTISQTDDYEGWRLHKKDGGLVIDVKSNEIVADGLSMPHSPRLHNGKLYVHQAGTGQFGFIDLKTGTFEEICFCPGFLRGIDFIGSYAVVGTSQSRHDKLFNGLALESLLKKRKEEPQCGLFIIDLDKGKIVHNVQIEGVVTEIYDIRMISGILRPAMIGLKDKDVERMFSIEPST